DRDGRTGRARARRAGVLPQADETERREPGEPPQMSHSLVSVRNLWVRLGGNDILRGLSADVPRGQITALIGLNGSGKTTLLKALLKEVPCSGRIDFHCGHDHTRPTPQHVGYVPQKLYFDANLPLTVRDLLALALQRRPLFLGVSRRVERQMG